MINKGNSLYDKFITRLKESHFYGNNKRILKILTDDDMSVLNYRTMSNFEKKMAQEHDALILSLIEIIQNDYRDLCSISGAKDYIEINSFIDQKLLQIAKIRMVIIPEFLINTTIHSVSNYKYAVLRALWLDNDFRKIKKFSISLGNIESLEMDVITKNQKTNKSIDTIEIKNAKSSLTEKLLNLYEEEYR